MVFFSFIKISEKSWYSCRDPNLLIYRLVKIKPDQLCSIRCLPIICVNRYSCTIARPDNHSTKHHQQQIPNYHRPDTSNPFHTCPSSSQKLNYPCIFICRQNFIYSLKQNHPLSPNEKLKKNKLIRFHCTNVNLISLFFYNLMSQPINLTPTSNPAPPDSGQTQIHPSESSHLPACFPVLLMYRSNRYANLHSFLLP